MLGECTTMLAHELNQPLTAILNNAQAARQYLESGDAKVEEIKDIMDDIVRDDKRASDIIHHLRRMVQKEEPIRKAIDINASIREIVDIIFMDIKKNGIRLNMQLSDDLPKVWVGQIEIQQVVLNFLTNAIKTMVDITNSVKLITILTGRFATV